MQTTNDLMRILRSKLQESNSSKVSDQELLDALNVAQDECFNLVARRYPDSLAANIDLTVDSDGIFTIPEDAFEQRLTRVYRVRSNISYQLDREDYREIDRWQGVTGVPTHYAILRNKGYIVPTPTVSGYTYRASYLQDVPPLVQEQGLIDDFAVAGGGNAQVTVSSLGSRITADTSSLDRFVNVIDGQSGLIKATLEVKSIDTTTGVVVFKATPTRTKVYNRTVSSDIPSDIEQEDYLCTADGSCVLFFKKPNSNYILQHATTEIKRSLGMDAQLEEMALSRYEENIEKLNSGRENTHKVHRTRSRTNNRRF